MAYIFKLPDVGEGMHEGEIASWLIKVGDHVKEGQAILELQNDKLLQEILSPHEGIVTKILVGEGTSAQVGEPLVEFDGQGENHQEVNDVKEVPKVAKPIELVSQPEILSKSIDQVIALPSIRRIAYQRGIDLTQLKGTGDRGQITLNDLDQGNAKVSASIAVLPPVGSQEVVSVSSIDEMHVEKLTPTRKAIAKAMSQSKHTIPHVTLFDEVEVSELVAHRQSFKDIASSEGIKLTFLPYVMKALVAAARKFPEINSMIQLEEGTQTFYHHMNIGFATDTEKGLIVPNIKQVETKSIFTLAKEIELLSYQAHESTIKVQDITGGTMTITNIGSANGSWFTPIINYPEVMILGVGRIKKQPIVNELDEIVVGQVMPISLSFDHRVFDGVTAQLVMNEIKRLLSHPSLLLMEV